MPKIGLGKDVYTAAVERTKWTFDNFERVYLSFSAGKDSTVMIHIAAQEARERGVKLGVLMVDLEGQYKLTIDHANRVFKEYNDVIDLHWVCLPISLRNAVSVYDPKWVCWDKEEKENWIRQPPEQGIIDESLYPFFEHGMEFEEFVPFLGNGIQKGKVVLAWLAFVQTRALIGSEL